MFSLIKRPVFFAVPALTAAASFFATGCAKTSPAVGTWTGQTPLKSSATLTLAADGTGTVSIPPIMQSKPITWKEGDDKKIDLNLAPAASASAGAPSAPPLTAFLGDDKKTMTVAFPMFSITLNKTDAAAAAK